MVCLKHILNLACQTYCYGELLYYGLFLFVLMGRMILLSQIIEKKKMSEVQPAIADTQYLHSFLIIVYHHIFFAYLCMIVCE